MPINKDIKKVMVIGSGPIVIGQAAEFDYAGTQACRVLKDAGLDVVLVNSNPATIMTDKALADEIEFKLKEAGVEPHHIEGKLSGWICLDFSTVVVHVFHKEQRQYFQLEHLWEDGDIINTEEFLTE